MKKIVFLTTVSLISVFTSRSQATSPGSTIYTSDANGKVGIGTTSPATKLDVRGGVALGVGAPSVHAGGVHSVEITGAGGYTPLAIIGGSGTVEIWKDYTPTKALMFGAGAPGLAADGDFHFSTYNGSSWADRLVIQNNTGYASFTTKVAIGGVDLTRMTDYSLAVNGNVVARKIKITQNNPWPDYVFYPSYQLRSLSSLEDYIKQYKHLPDVPSAEEIETNGNDLGATQAALLKKIEELTLYVIELEKKNVQLGERVKMLEEKSTVK